MSARESQELLVVPVESEPAASSRTQIESVVVGTLVGFLESAVPLVIYPGQPGSAAIPARAAFDLRGEHVGHEVVLMFEGGDPLKPLVMGCLQEKSAWPLVEQPAQVEVDADGQRLVIDAKNEIVLRCGKASITLTKAGKVLIRGAYLLSRSSGVNRIKGGSVQIN